MASIHNMSRNSQLVNLQVAIDSDNLAVVKEMLKRKTTQMQLNRQKIYIDRISTEMMEILLQKGYTVEMDDYACLYDCIVAKSLASFAVIMNRCEIPCHIIQQCFMSVCINKNPEFLNYLIMHNYKIKEHTTLVLALNNLANDNRLIKILFQAADESLWFEMIKNYFDLIPLAQLQVVFPLFTKAMARELAGLIIVACVQEQIFPVLKRMMTLETIKSNWEILRKQMAINKAEITVKRIQSKEVALQFKN